VVDWILATEPVDADVTIPDGRMTKADVVENDRQTKAKRRLMMEENDFMVMILLFLHDKIRGLVFSVSKE